MGRTYVGRRDGGSGRVEVYGPGGVSPLRDGGRGIAWGMVDVGTVALAHAVLADVFGTGASDGLAVTFAADVLAELPRDGFALAEEEVRRWRDPEPARRLSRPEVVDHLGAVAISDEEDEAVLLRRIVERCWDEQTLRH